MLNVINAAHSKMIVFSTEPKVCQAENLFETGTIYTDMCDFEKILLPSFSPRESRKVEFVPVDDDPRV